MKKLLLGLGVCVVVFLCTQPVFASPIYNTDTDHWYDVVYGTWHEAEEEAVSFGGHLATINDADENDWVYENFGYLSHFWIGFTDEELEGTWAWASGEPVTYANWYPGEPNNAWGNEDYAAVYGKVLPPAYQKKWNDVPCDYNEGSMRGVGEYASYPVPEPATMILMGIGLLGAGALRKKKK